MIFTTALCVWGLVGPWLVHWVITQDDSLNRSMIRTALQDGPAHPNEVLRRISTTFESTPPRLTTVQRLLKQLALEGWVVSQTEPGGPERFNYPKNVYRLLSSGVR